MTSPPNSYSKPVWPEGVNSGAAKTQGTEHKEIDGWLIWNIWQVANKDSAEVVESWRVHSSPLAALPSAGFWDSNTSPLGAGFFIWTSHTDLPACQHRSYERRGPKPAARQFESFMASEEGRRIFAKWGWKTP